VRSKNSPETGRPARRPWHASTWLDDFAIITWAVEPDRVARVLPVGFEPDVRDGEALVSVVAFRDRDFRFRFAPWPRLSCGQVNYRTYVRRAGLTGVWFFGSSLDSRLVAVPRKLWKMPWHHTTIDINANWSESGCSSWSIAAKGDWGGAEISLGGQGRPLDIPPGFTDEREVSSVLLDPAIGWYERLRGAPVGHYSVWHPPLGPEAATVIEARSDVLTDLELLGPDARIHSAGVQRHVHFDVHTPPSVGDPSTPRRA
jgi:hypothetical protein